MCPSHLHFLCNMSVSIGFWFVLCQRLILLIFSGQRIFIILRKHVLIKVCIFFEFPFVVLQVSAPYSRTLFTFELKRRSFVLLPISLDFHRLFSCMKAVLALLILVLMSASVPPKFIHYTTQVGKGFYFLDRLAFQQQGFHHGCI